jgi:membrane fusion protein, multidrug efflux system
MDRKTISRVARILVLVMMEGVSSYPFSMAVAAEVGKDTAHRAEKVSSGEGGASKDGAEHRGAGGGNRGGGRRGNGAVAVRVVSAQLGVMDRTIDALGTVVPISTVTVRSRVEGVLEQIYFQEGQRVEKGHVLAQIERAPLEVQKKQIEGLVQKDQALLTNAKLDLARYQTLVAQEAGTKQQRDTQLALVRQLEGTLKTDQAQLDNARLQLGYTRITAPISGRIGLKQLDVGNLIKAGDASILGVITQLSPMTVVFSIPQNQLSSVLPLMEGKTKLLVEAYDSQLVTRLASGTLMAVDSQIDPTTGTIKLKARFDNKDHRLFPNQFVNVTLHFEHLANVITLPAAAVQHDSKGAYLFVLKPDQTVAVRQVKEGLSRAGQVVIAQGITPGEQVVIEGVDGLRDGAKVKVITQ